MVIRVMEAQNVFVLQYEDGKYVKRDDSTGPMSTGGYPSPVNTMREATFWHSSSVAARYAKTCRSMGVKQLVYPVKVQYTLVEPVTHPTWTECDHDCIPSPESTAPEAKHFLDCPAWRDLLSVKK